MSDERIPLSPNFKFFLTFHYSLGFSIVHSDDPKVQLGRLRDIAAKLNSANKNNELRDCDWSVQKFTDSFPLSLIKKHGYLLAEWKGSTEKLQDIINNVKSECTGVELDSESIEETVVYFDYGVGSINLLIKGKLEKKEAITCLGDLALSIQENIQKRAKKGLCGLCVFDN